MTMHTDKQKAVFSWLNNFLRDRGLQFSRSGFKGGKSIGNHDIDATTGFWVDPQYSSNKPPRLLLHVEVSESGVVAQLPEGLEEIGIGSSNTAQGDKAGLAVRILPLIKVPGRPFFRADEFEANILFLFDGPLLPGSSSDAFVFNVNNGSLSRSINRNKQQENYIFAAVLGLREREDTFSTDASEGKVLSYGEMLDAIAQLINSRLSISDVESIDVYNLSDDSAIEKLEDNIINAFAASGRHVRIGVKEYKREYNADDSKDVEVPENQALIGVDPSVYRQINAALRSGKQHIMLYGPPGTGKTSLARWIASSLPGGEWTLVTGSSDWSSQDIVGGYQPIGAGEVDFVPGILLRSFDHPLIIDEMNRCDIDKVIGPLFTVLSGQQTTLPYRIDIGNKDSQPYVILPQPKSEPADHEFAPGPDWRLIATINSIDKASLYQMSYALSRRFGWVYVDAPSDLAGFIYDYLKHLDSTMPLPASTSVCPLASIWEAVNRVRVIGPAPIIDTIAILREVYPSANFFTAVDDAMREGILDAMDMVILPMLDGILLPDAENLSSAFAEALELGRPDVDRLNRRLESLAI